MLSSSSWRSRISKTSYYSERNSKGGFTMGIGGAREHLSRNQIIDLQLQHWDEIKKFLDEDELYKCFKKDKEEYYKNLNPTFDTEQLDQYLRCVRFHSLFLLLYTSCLFCLMPLHISISIALISFSSFVACPLFRHDSLFCFY